MDTIEFRLSTFNYTAAANPSAVACIFINGENLLDTLYEFERREGLTVIAHAPITVAELHENLSEQYKSNPVAIFGCDCGVTYCWPLIVSVKVGASYVAWENFILPHASSSTKNFGRFVFDRAQYFSEVEKLRRLADGGVQRC